MKQNQINKWSFIVCGLMGINLALLGLFLGQYELTFISSAGAFLSASIAELQ